MRRLLVTGGFGKIGRYFVQHHSDQYQICVADISTDRESFSENVETVEADLTDFAECEKLCDGVDTVVHLAGVADPAAAPDSTLRVNISTTQNVFKAAARAKCQRVIFASSAQTIESYPEDVQVSSNMLVRPKNIYGVTKCFGEALAAYYAYNHGVSSICLRIGAYEFPEDHTSMSRRDLSAFLHPDDLNQLLLCCIEAENIRYEVLNAISDNRYKRLDITESREKVGYAPTADAFELFALLKE